MLDINQKLFIGKGGQRECFIHPLDSSKVLKILYRCNSKKEDVNRLEYTYFNILKKRAISFKHLTPCYGYEMTNKGKALVFQRVLNFDNSISISLREAIVLNKVNLDTQEYLLNQLGNYLKKEKILFIDYSLDNLLLKEYEKNLYKLVIIDGLGAKRYDLRFFFYSYCLMYTSYKINKQWDKFITEYMFERELIQKLKNYSKKKIDLKNAKILGKGTGRECYLHPYDYGKVIKKEYKNAEHSKQNLIEYKYYDFLRRKNTNMKQIVNCYGFQKINDGTRGLVFDRVMNYDGKPSISLRKCMILKKLTINTLDRLFNELVEYINKNNILFIDTSLTNIFVQEYSFNQYKLIIIDGLGAKKYGFKFWLYLHLNIYKSYKIKKQIRKLEANYKSDLKRAIEGDSFSKV